VDSSAVEDIGHLASKGYKATCFTGRREIRTSETSHSLLQFFSGKLYCRNLVSQKIRNSFVQSNCNYQENDHRHCSPRGPADSLLLKTFEQEPG